MERARLRRWLSPHLQAIRNKWTESVRKCNKIWLIAFGDAAATIPPLTEDPPNLATRLALEDWLRQAEQLIATLDAETKNTIAKMKADLFTATVNKAASNLSGSWKRTIANLKRAVIRLETKKDPPRFVVAIGNDDAPEQREQQDKERAAKAAAFWQEIAKETRQEPPNQTHKEWEEGLPIAPQAKAKKLLEAITVQEIREGTFPDAKSMPTYNPITNRFYWPRPEKESASKSLACLTNYCCAAHNHLTSGAEQK